MVRLASFFVLASLAIAGLCAPWNNDHEKDKCEKRPEPGDDVKKCGDRFKEIIIFDDKCHDLFGSHFDDNKEIHDKEDPWFDNFSHGWKDNSDGLTKVFVEIIEEIKVLGQKNEVDSIVIIEAFEHAQKSFIQVLVIIFVNFKWFPIFKVTLIEWIKVFRCHFKDLVEVIVIVVEDGFKDRVHKCHDDLEFWFEQLLAICD